MQPERLRRPPALGSRLAGPAAPLRCAGGCPGAPEQVSPMHSHHRRPLALVLAALLAPAAATAATISVTTTADGSLPDQCTLRNATIAASTNTVAGACAAGE